ncbi:MAG: hypothetical protein ACRCZR_08185, partial [Cetobacterium sp.]
MNDFVNKVILGKDKKFKLLKLGEINLNGIEYDVDTIYLYQNINNKYGIFYNGLRVGVANKQEFTYSGFFSINNFKSTFKSIQVGRFVGRDEGTIYRFYENLRVRSLHSNWPKGKAYFSFECTDLIFINSII